MADVEQMKKIVSLITCEILCLNAWLNISPRSFTESTVLVDEQAEVRLRGVAFAFDRLAKASTFVFNANSSDFISEVSCSFTLSRSSP